MVHNKVLLVNPPYVEHVYSGKGARNAIAINIPLGLASIGAVLEKYNFPVEALDANVMNYGVQQTIDHLIKSKAKYIFFSGTTNTITKVYQISKKIKEVYPNCVIVVGGPHPAYAGRETLQECKDIDLAVIGEGEYTALEIAQGKEFEQIDGVLHRKDEKIVATKPRKRIENLDEIPFPARHLFPFEKYRPGAFFNTGVKNTEAISMLTSRGCPARCTFCSSVAFWGSKVRFRSAKNIVEEIEFLQKKYNTKQIAFFDDMFTFHLPRLEEFCNLLIDRKIKVRWWCYSRVSNLTKDMMILMKKAGCYALNFGLESGNEDILKRIKKNIKKEKVMRVVKDAKKLGLLVHASFQVGLPGDTKETIMETIDWAIKLGPHIPLFCITTPFPGTPLYEEAMANGWMNKMDNWDDAGLHLKTKFHTDTLTADEINKYYKLAQRKFFYRPGFFWMTAKHLLRNPTQIKGYWHAGKYMLTEQ
ncbi:radical SAM protein [Candidatus Woesearchaeota archaeon]|jgi:anaerobic magnesium-protoporphyrin IX monomethyl ester cyclase|nr:radical SAM protein [Candidatus Woesearchaeota archaeon]MBT5739540.1 radical SAM protein [Candidatus Woesearchaeota archaeon]